MYSDDVCAVCGDSLPPDHLYCREHAAEVDDRLHQIGALIPQVLDGMLRVSMLMSQIADETWDYVAEQDPQDPVWPPVPEVSLLADADAVDIDVDTEPGMVRVDLRQGLAGVLQAVAEGADTEELRRMARQCSQVEGANATH